MWALRVMEVERVGRCGLLPMDGNICLCERLTAGFQAGRSLSAIARLDVPQHASLRFQLYPADDCQLDTEQGELCLAYIDFGLSPVSSFCVLLVRMAGLRRCG